MKYKAGIYIINAFHLLLIFSCIQENPELQMQNLARLYEEKKITNSQMLHEMGKIYLKNNDNLPVKFDYFNRLIISGYSTHVIHRYLLQPEQKTEEEDMKLLLFALNEGKNYKLAQLFRQKFSGDYLIQLNKMMETSDSIIYYDTLTERIHRAESYLKRSRFYTRLGEPEMAHSDSERSLVMEPCFENAVFQQSLILFQKEKTKEIISLLEQCNQIHSDWHPVFYRLAFEIESVKNSGNTIEEKLFRQANLYVNNGFADIALKKNNELLGMVTEPNPDYLALQAFILYRLKNKNMAMKYIAEAESITGKKSRLGEMIVNME